MKKSKFLVLSLLAVSTLGLTSCGSQGPNGEKGEPGIQGKQGEPGKDGKDGVNGKDGKDGVPGKDGKNGINGADGKTAWSNTILPSVGGYVVPSVGSAIEGADVTFTVHVENDYTLTALFLNGENHSVEQKTDKTYETTAKMVKNGFVVSATFIKTADIATTPVVDQNTGKAYKDVSDAIKGKASTIRLLGDSKTTTADYLIFHKYNRGITIDLNNKVLTSTIIVYVDSDVTIKNGIIKGEFDIYHNAKATFENVKFDNGNHNNIFFPQVQGSDTYNKLDLTFKSCNFVGQGYGFVTNASKHSTSSYGKITFEGCTFTPKDPLNGGDATGLMINVPVNVEINNCIFNGSRQCLIVRCGTVEVKDSTFNYDKVYDGNDGAGYYLSGEWGGGNRVATAMITVGCLNGSYPADATLKLTGTNTFNGEYDENHKSIVIACGTNSATVEMTSEIAEALKANAMTMKPETVPEGKTITIKIDGTAVSDWPNN